MSNIIDSYGIGNIDSVTTPIFGSSTQEGFGQCFTGDGEQIVTTRWYLNKTGSPTGNVVAKIWSMTGTFGTNGNVGSVLATADNLDVTTISTTAGLVTFTFSGANQYVTTNGTHYVTTFEFLGGSAGNGIQLSYDGSAATHPGTWVVRNTGVWTPNDLNIDLIFFVDGVVAAVNVTVNLTGVSATPTIGTGTVTIGSAVVTPPEAVLVAGGRRLYWLEDETVQLEGVAASPRVGRIEAIGTFTQDELSRKFPFPKPEVPQRLAPRRKAPPLPPAFVYVAGVHPAPRIGSGKVEVYYEDIDEELVAILQEIA